MEGEGGGGGGGWGGERLGVGDGEEFIKLILWTVPLDN